MRPPLLYLRAFARAQKPFDYFVEKIASPLGNLTHLCNPTPARQSNPRYAIQPPLCNSPTQSPHNPIVHFPLACA